MSTSGGSSGGGSGLPYQTFSGSPVGVVTPTAAGYIGLDTTNDRLYFASAATSADWVQVSGTNDATANGLSSSASGGTTLLDNSSAGLQILTGTAGGNIGITTEGATGSVTVETIGAGSAASLVANGGDVAVASSGDTLQFFQGNQAAKQAITGMLSAVVDPNAQAVLTALIAALADASGYSLVTDSTT